MPGRLPTPTGLARALFFLASIFIVTSISTSIQAGEIMATVRLDASKADVSAGSRSLKLVVPSHHDVAGVRLEVRSSVAVETPPTVRIGETPAARVAAVHSWHGYRIVFLELEPYFMVANSVRLAQDLNVYLDTRPNGQLAITRLRHNAELRQREADLVRSFVDNPQDVVSFAPAPGKAVPRERGFVPAAYPDLEGSDVEYVIVTPAALAGSFQALADWKTRRGVPTVVQTIESIQSTARLGADLQETIRNYLQDAYSLWSVQWVLLGGDTDWIPARFLSSSFGLNQPEEIPADLYFAGIDGNWNANGNAIWGEAPATSEDPDPDEGDMLAELYLSRAPVTTTEEADNFIQKIIAYETPYDPTYQDRTLFLGEVLFPTAWSPGENFTMDGGQLSEDLIAAYFPPTVPADRRYETYQSYAGAMPLSRDLALSSVNEGYNLVNHMGHGFRYNMSVGDLSITNGDAEALVNGDRLSILNVLNCTSLAFDFSCLAERFIVNDEGGAVAAVGASRSAYPLPSKEYQEDFYDLLLNQNVWQLGALFNGSRLNQVAAASTESAHRWTHYIYNSLGDPELNVYSGLPEVLTVSHDGNTGLGESALLIHVEDSGAQPVAGAKVCLQKGTDDYEVGLTDANGDVTLNFTSEAAGAIDVTVTGRNLQTYLGNITVNASAAAYVSLDAAQVDDDVNGGSNGNGDTIIDAGETIDLQLILRNDGGSDATAITGNVSVSDPYVSVINANVAATNVPAGGSAPADAPVRLSIAANAPDRHVFELQLALSDGIGGNWTDKLRREVHGPALELVRLEIDDVVSGNGNGVPDESETFDVRAFVKNFGSGQVDGISALLQSSNQFIIEVVQGSSSYASISQGVEAANIVDFTLTTHFVDDTQVDLRLTDGFGRLVILPFDLRRPTATNNLAFDPSSHPTVMLCTWDPVGDSDLSGYHVYRSLSASGPWTRVTVDPTPVSYYRDTNLQSSTRYYYYVTSIDTSGNQSAASSVVSTSTNPPQVVGWPINMTVETSSSPALGDLLGDAGLEIVQGNLKLYAWYADGQEILDADNDAQTWGLFQNDTGTTVAAVALGEFDGSEGLEVVSCNWDDNTVFVIDGDGSLLWSRTPTNSGVVGYWGAPSVGDVDRDGDNEIFAASRDGRLYAWNHDGSPLLAANPDGTFAILSEWMRGSVALGNLDNDFDLEIVYADLFGDIHAWNPDGSSLPGFPIVTGQLFYNSPVLGDVDADGTLEIVAVAQSGAPNLHVIRGDGSQLAGFPVSVTQEHAYWSPSPALADLDLDGKLEILVGSNAWTTSNSKLHVIRWDGSSHSGWPRSTLADSESSPIVADFDGDGSPDIVYGGQDGVLRGWSQNGIELDGFPLSVGDFIRATPSAGDIDSDGDIDLVLAGWDKNVYIWDLPAAYDESLAQWPSFLHDASRTGRYGATVPDATDVDDGTALDSPPRLLELLPNVPNPFNPFTRIRYGIPSGPATHVRLYVVDVRGRLVRRLVDQVQGAGRYELMWDGRNEEGRQVGSGVYFSRLQWGEELRGRSMLVIR